MLIRSDRAAIRIGEARKERKAVGDLYRDILLIPQSPRKNGSWKEALKDRSRH